MSSSDPEFGSPVSGSRQSSFSGQYYEPSPSGPQGSGQWSASHKPIDAWLRECLGLGPHQSINLWALPDPPPGVRPHVTYKFLVALAIYGSPDGRLTLQEIYNRIEDRFPYYKSLPEEPGRDGRYNGGKQWHRSIRHNLSLESIFVNTSRPIALAGKGGYWSLTNQNGYGQKRVRGRKLKGKRTSESTQDDDSSMLVDDDSNDGGTSGVYMDAPRVL